MTETIRYSNNGQKFRIYPKIESLTIDQIQNGTYPICPIIQTDIFKMNYEELKKYCCWKAQNMIISNHKKYLALCKRANIQGSSGQITQADWRREHFRLFINYGIEEDEIEKQENYWYRVFINTYVEQIREHKAHIQNLKPILTSRFNKELKKISVYTYDYAAHWNAIGYKAEHFVMREAKSKIVNWFRNSNL
jgi:hypothetical protein